MDTLLLTGDDIHRIATHVGLDALMDRLIDRLTNACATFDPEVTAVPARAGFSYTHPTEGLIEWMPCMRRGAEAVVKVVGYHPANGRSGVLPTIVSTVSAYDTASGHLQCLMDATFLTALRTGAASAVATRILARSEAETVGLIGAGAQAVTQLHALTRVLPVRRALVYDADLTTAASFAERVAAVAGHVQIEQATADEVAASVDVLCTATSVGVGEGPVFETTDLRPWCHVNAVGSDFPGKVELPLSLLHWSLVCPDFRTQAHAEGECQRLAPETVGPDLAALVRDAHQYAPARDRLTVFDSTGWAVEDQVAMELFIEEAEVLGLGQRLPLEALDGDSLNPYGFVTAPALQVEA